MELTTNNVYATTLKLMANKEEAEKYGLNDDTDTSKPIEGITFVQGAMGMFAFVTERIESVREDVTSMLGQLKDTFMTDGGGGMSLMGMVETKDGTLWGEQINADNLYALGAALGLCKYTLPREMWNVLPGAMPYITVTLPALTTAEAEEK